MPKRRTLIDRAIDSLEDEIRVRTAAIAALQQQRTGGETARVARTAKRVRRPATAVFGGEPKFVDENEDR
jgi:hypothetical protein